MHTELIEQVYFSFFERFRPLEDKERVALLENTTLKTFPKGHYFVREGDLEKDCFFILKGCVREYRIKDAEEITSNFYIEHEFALSLDSFAKGVPSPNFLQCIEDTTVAIGGEEDSKKLFETCPSLESLAMQIMEEGMGRLHKQMTEYMSNSPEERYLNLMNEKPDLLQRVPQYQLASFIGVKPESLSRIRRRLTTLKVS